jgi:hypothetical protein
MIELVLLKAPLASMTRMPHFHVAAWLAYFV